MTQYCTDETHEHTCHPWRPGTVYNCDACAYDCHCHPDDDYPCVYCEPFPN